MFAKIAIGFAVLTALLTGLSTLPAQPDPHAGDATDRSWADRLGVKKMGSNV